MSLNFEHEYASYSSSIKEKFVISAFKRLIQGMDSCIGGVEVTGE